MQRFVFCATESMDSNLILDGVLLWVLCIRWKISAIVGFELGTQRLRGKELSSVPLSLWSAWAFWMGFYWQLCFIWRKTLTTVGFELRTLNSEIQRFILCVTESVESCLGWGVTESFVLYDKKKSSATVGCELRTSWFIHRDFTLSTTESVVSCEMVLSRALFNMMKNNYHINAIVGNKYISMCWGTEFL